MADQDLSERMDRKREGAPGGKNSLKIKNVFIFFIIKFSLKIIRIQNNRIVLIRFFPVAYPSHFFVSPLSRRGGVREREQQFVVNNSR